MIKAQAEVQTRILKKTGITAVSIADDAAATLAKNGLTPGYTTFIYDDGWKVGGVAKDPATIGITVTGTPANGDTFQVAYNDGTILAPVTSGELALGEFPSVLHKDPIYQYAETSSWGLANSIDYVDIPLEFRVQDVDGNADKTKRALLAKKVYLSDLTIAAKTVSGKQDVTEAVRFAITDTSAEHTVTATGGTVTNASTFNTKVAAQWCFGYLGTIWSRGSWGSCRWRQNHCQDCRCRPYLRQDRDQHRCLRQPRFERR